MSRRTENETMTHDTLTTLDRRRFLRGSLAAGAGAAALGGSLSLPARAADASGYKALVCVHLGGGMDCHDTMIPYDQASYDEWAGYRAPLISRYADGSRRRENLLPLAGAQGGLRWAFPQQLEPLHRMYADGDLAVVANVGPLEEPTTRSQVRAGSVRMPPTIGSHNDHAAIWLSGAPEGLGTGWGGKIADLFIQAGVNDDPALTCLGFGADAVFLNHGLARSTQLSRYGVPQLSGMTPSHFGSAAVPGMIEAHYRGQSGPAPSLFAADYAERTNRAFGVNVKLRDVLEGSSVEDPGFPTSTKFGQEMKVVLEIIAQRAALSVGRQVFYVPWNIWDSHSNQATTLSEQQAYLGQTLGAFSDGLKAIGEHGNVTTFTTADFGRALTTNGNGTDHGWGGHHLVMGGAVRGGRIAGDMPPGGLLHEQDYESGRLVPSMAVEQYAAELARWFGLGRSDVSAVFPKLGRFDEFAVSLF